MGYLLLCVRVLVHGAQGVLDPGEPRRQAQQQADHSLQVADEQVVPLQLHGQTALSYQRLQRLASLPVLLDLSLESTPGLIQTTQVLLDVGHQQTLTTLREMDNM